MLGLQCVSVCVGGVTRHAVSSDHERVLMYFPQLGFVTHGSGHVAVGSTRPMAGE